MATPQSLVYELIELSGRSFREQPVSCPHCAWAGEAGQLANIPDKKSIGAAAYACPSCHEELAYHSGLTEREIEEELADIRAELKIDLRKTLLVPEPTVEGADDAVPARANLDFHTIRERIRELS